MNEEFSKEQIEEYADGLLNDYKEETKKNEPFIFEISLGEKQYKVSYAKDELGSWKFQDYEELT